MRLYRNFNRAPKRSGVYQLFSGAECIYVGSSVCLRHRLVSHKLRRIADGFKYRLVPAEDLNAEEQRLLDELRPPMNKAKIVRGRKGHLYDWPPKEGK